MKHHDEIIYDPKSQKSDAVVAWVWGVFCGAAGIAIVNLFFGVQL